MKKILGTLAVAGIASVPSVNADVIGFEIGGYQWEPEYVGTIESDEAGLNGSPIDLQDDLGFTEDSNNIIWASIEHPIPFLPNFMLTSSAIETNAVGSPVTDVTFNGETFSATETVTTFVDLSNIEYTLYYEILDNWVNLDLGVTIREYDGEIALTTSPTGSNMNEQEVIDYVIPLLYGKARFDLPLTGLFIDGIVQYSGYDDDSISDAMVSLGYESDIGFGAKLGYRTFDLDIVEDELSADLQFDGAYASLFFHF